MTFYFVEVYIRKDQSYSPTPSYKLEVTYYNSMYVYYIWKRIWFFKYILEVDASDLVGRGAMRMWTYVGLYK